MRANHMYYSLDWVYLISEIEVKLRVWNKNIMSSYCTNSPISSSKKCLPVVKSNSKLENNVIINKVIMFHHLKTKLSFSVE